jgi:two-component system cell cycle sensor histidine kinase/response regulator CckA
MRLLFVETCAADVDLALAELRRAGRNPVHECVSSLDALADALRRETWSVVLCADRLPGFTGLDALRVVRAHDEEVPFIVVSAAQHEEHAIDIVDAGANDYVLANRLHRLVPAIDRELRDVQLRHELRRHAEQQRAVANLGHAALRGESIPALLDRVVMIVPSLLGTDGCGILQAVDGHFQFVRTTAWPEHEVVDIPAAAMAAFTLQTGEPAVSSNLAAETRFPPPRLLLEKGVVSGITVPIGTGGAAPWGVLGTHSCEERQFTINDVEFLRALATVLAQAIERDRVDQQLLVQTKQQNQSERLTSLGRMAATIAHEFNNVLMGISPFVEVIRRGKSIDSSLDHIARAVKRGKRVTEEILRFTRHTQPQRAAFDVAPWIEDILFEARTVVPSSCHIEAAIHSYDLVIDGDASQLQQVFTNLILNAREAMPYGGTLSLEVRREPADASLPFGVVEHPERFAHCTVRDTGCGMNAETLRHIYEPMFTTKRNGTGFGLAVAHQVVERHGGAIFVESTVDVGTTFHLFLPLANPDDRPQTLVEIVTARAGVGRHVLLVEDDRTVAVGLASLLELEGLRVDVVETGAAAIEVIDHITPDVIVLDVGLPDMEGTTVYASIAAKMPHMPVIFSTGHADRRRLDALLGQKNVGYLLKPYASTTLLQAIEQVLM